MSFDLNVNQNQLYIDCTQTHILLSALKKMTHIRFQ